MDRIQDRGLDLSRATGSESMKSFFEAYRQGTPLSNELFNRAKRVMPGGVSHNIHYFLPYPFFIKGGKGSKLWDVDGNEYVDLWMGNYTHILGHHPDLIVEALERQLRNGIHWGTVFEKQVEWAELIQELIPSAERVRFCCSGTEATMYAVRLARGYTGKNTILKVKGGWHGPSSDLSVAIFPPYDQEESLGLLPELQRYTKTILFNDLPETLEVIHQNRDDLAGIIVEPVIGIGGFVPATLDYLRMLRIETEKWGALLIFDEVISGFRVALGGAQALFQLIPDLTTLGKIMGGGLPAGAVVGKKEILEKTSPEKRGNKWERILIGGGTFSAHPLTVAAGLTMLRYLKDHAGQLYPLLEKKGKRATEGIQEAFRREGIKTVVTGIGSLFQTHFPLQEGVTLNSPHSISQWSDIPRKEVEFRLRMLTKGVHVTHGGGALSTAHSDEDIEKIIQATAEAAGEMAQKS